MTIQRPGNLENLKTAAAARTAATASCAPGMIVVSPGARRT